MSNEGMELIKVRHLRCDSHGDVIAVSGGLLHSSGAGANVEWPHEMLSVINPLYFSVVLLVNSNRQSFSVTSD